MFKVKVNSSNEHQVELSNNQIMVNGLEKGFDIKQISERDYHVLVNHKSYRVEVVQIDHEQKVIELKINNQIFNCKLRDQFDDLLQSLGMDNLQVKKLNEIKAPMPGLVLKILIEEGQEFKKGDNLLVLEAMKMENILKAPEDGMVRTIKVKPGDKVEKNEVLVQLS
jgi:biotin carboxyl carrier protein